MGGGYRPPVLNNQQFGDGITMTSIYDLKPRFQGLLRPLTNALAGAGITANQVTVTATLLSIVTGTTIAFWPDKHWSLLLIAPVLFIRMALNAIDGMLAREHHQASKLGAILNELGDVLSDAALYLPLALVPGIEPVWVVLAVLLAVISEMTGVVAVQIGAARRYDGPMGKSDRALVFGAVSLLLGLGVAPGVWTTGVFILVLALLGLTIANRARRALVAVA
jgi:CDP-diacylglycerol---glycerol-3-phosphate 3-phosphatidyltransferase